MNSKQKKVEQGVFGAGCHVTIPSKTQETPITVALIGHSFTARLVRDNFKVDCDRFKNCVTRIVDANIKCSIAGLSGAKINDLELILDMVKEHYSIVVIDIGSNDLCDNVPVPSIVADLKRCTANILSTHPEIEMLAICQITYRDEVPPYCAKTLDVYNQDVDALNHEIIKMTRNKYNMMQWHHKGLINPEDRITRDGVHPDTVSGKLKYFVSITDACLFAKKEVNTRRGMTKTQWRKSKKARWEEIATERYESFVVKQINQDDPNQAMAQQLIMHRHTSSCPTGCREQITEEEKNQIMRKWALRKINKE